MGMVFWNVGKTISSLYIIQFLLFLPHGHHIFVGIFLTWHNKPCSSPHWLNECFMLLFFLFDSEDALTGYGRSIKGFDFDNIGPLCLWRSVPVCFFLLFDGRSAKVGDFSLRISETVIIWSFSIRAVGLRSPACSIEDFFDFGLHVANISQCHLHSLSHYFTYYQ